MSLQDAQLSFDAAGAALSWPGGPSLREVVAVVRYRAEGAAHTLLLLEPDRPFSAHGLCALWRWQVEGDGYRVWVELSNSGDESVVLEAVDVLATPALDLGTPPAAWSVYQNGWQSWTPTFSRHLSSSRYTDPGTSAYRVMHQPHWAAGDESAVSSEWVTVVAGVGRGEVESGESSSRLPFPASSLLLGFITTGGQLSEIRLDSIAAAALAARCHFDGAMLVPDGSVRSEVLALRAGPDPLALLEGWAETAGQEMKARVPSSPPTGWCTWYYFYGENTASDVLGNLEAIDHYGLPLDVLLLDDGYQAAIGDWLSPDQEKFPQGVEPMAQAIREAGHRVGVWLAPFGAAADSRLFAEHPGWFLRDGEGGPVVAWNHLGVGDCYALDCTHPEVLAWLRETFGRMRDGWGVEFFKIDFIFAAALAGRRYDPAATRAQALRRGVEAVREAIGADAFLLGCGAPLGPCIGLVDGMRVGPDVDPNWHPIWRHDLSMPSVETALCSSLTRSPFHGRLWANDPDCLLVRQRGTDLDLVLNEVRTLSALVALTGGLTFDSDHLAAIRPGRLKYLRQALPPMGVSARPLDLFENELPRLLLLSVEREWGRWWVAGAVNWEDHTTETTIRLADLGLSPGRYHVYHYWLRRYLGVTDDAVTIRRHQPHETAVLLFKPVSDDPDLLTTTFHVCQGAVEVADVQGAKLEVERQTSGFVLCTVLEKRGRQFGQLLFTVPGGWRAVEARVDGNKRPLVRVAPGVVSLGLTLEGRAEVEVRFDLEP